MDSSEAQNSIMAALCFPDLSNCHFYLKRLNAAKKFNH
jgi:hypothetical protein